MKLEADKHQLKITLSERNLLALLSKLHTPGSARSLLQVDPNYRLLIVAEDDADHYGGRAAPGVMHPVTEKILEELKKALSADEMEINHENSVDHS